MRGCIQPWQVWSGNHFLFIFLACHFYMTTYMILYNGNVNDFCVNTLPFMYSTWYQQDWQLHHWSNSNLHFGDIRNNRINKDFPAMPDTSIIVFIWTTYSVTACNLRCVCAKRWLRHRHILACVWIVYSSRYIYTQKKPICIFDNDLAVYEGSNNHMYCKQFPIHTMIPSDTLIFEM